VKALGKTGWQLFALPPPPPLFRQPFFKTKTVGLRFSVFGFWGRRSCSVCHFAGRKDWKPGQPGKTGH